MYLLLCAINRFLYMPQCGDKHCVFNHLQDLCGCMIMEIVQCTFIVCASNRFLYMPHCGDKQMPNFTFTIG